MHLSQLYTSSHVTTKNLDEYLRLYSAVVSNLRVETDVEKNVYVCQVDVPCVPTVSSRASTESEAVAKLLVKVQAVLATSSWPDAWRSLASSTGPTTKVEHTKVEQTKARQSTIGVTSTQRFVQALRGAGRVGECYFAETARRLASAGFEEFDDRILDESPAQVLEEFSNELSQWRHGETQHWSLRLDPSVYVRLKLSAKEFGKSASELALMCMAHSLAKSRDRTAANDMPFHERRVDRHEHA